MHIKNCNINYAYIFTSFFSNFEQVVLCSEKLEKNISKLDINWV